MPYEHKVSLRVFELIQNVTRGLLKGKWATRSIAAARSTQVRCQAVRQEFSQFMA
jgi:hypothetical protein